MFLSKKSFLFLISVGVFLSVFSLSEAKANTDLLVKVTGEKVNVRSGPNTDFEIRFQVRKGDILGVSKTSRFNDWILVGTKDPREVGWINSNYVVGWSKPFSLTDIRDSSKGVPSGFRGIEWGISIGSLMKDNIRLIPVTDYFSDVKEATCYTKEGENLEFDGIKVKKIPYEFFKDRFFRVFFIFDCSDWWKMKQALEIRYGELMFYIPTEAKGINIKFMSKNYETVEIECIENCNEDYDFCSLAYKYIPILEQYTKGYPKYLGTQELVVW